MSFALYLLQHGEAVSGNSDPERPLSNAGRGDIERLAGHLAAKQVSVDRIIHSGKLRAEQSARIIADTLGTVAGPVEYPGICPNDDPGTFIDNLDMNQGSILLASHMPFVSKLCSVLLTGSPGAAFAFTPASLACLRFEDAGWALAWMLTPDIL